MSSQLPFFPLDNVNLLYIKEVINSYEVRRFFYIRFVCRTYFEFLTIRNHYSIVEFSSPF